jgi:hypothetical protein
LKLAANQYAKIREFSKQQLIRKFSIQFAYGHREILLNYSKIDTSSLLIGVLQHGVGPSFTLYSDWPTPRNRTLERSNLWVYSKKAATELAAGGVKNVSAIGSPWLYSKILHGYSASTTPPKTKFLVFPMHYSFSYLSKINPADILEKIQYWKLIAGSEELEICLYWSEFLNPVWQQVAREEGVNLVCAGIAQTAPQWSLADTRVNFYVNLRNIIDSATHCIFESFTSAIFYACDLGKRVGVFQTQSSLAEVNRAPAFQQENQWLFRNTPEIFNTCEDNSVLGAISYDLLGYDELLSPEILSNVLKYQRGVIPKQLE